MVVFFRFIPIDIEGVLMYACNGSMYDNSCICFSEEKCVILHSEVKIHGDA